MDQLEYYIVNDNFQEFINYCNLTNSSTKSNNENEDLKQKISEMESHIYNLHMCIFNEISKKGLKGKFIKKLKEEINNFEHKKLKNNTH